MSPVRSPSLVRRCLAVLCLLVLFCGSLGTRGTPWAPRVARASEFEDLERELEELQKEMDALLDKLNSTKKQEKGILSDLTKIERQLETTRSQLHRLENDLAYLEGLIRVATAELRDAEARLAQRQGYLARRVRAISEGGMVGYLEVLLGSASFSDFLSRFELLQQLIRMDQQLLGQVKQERAGVAARKADLEGKMARALSLRQQTSARKASYEYQQSVKERYLAQVRSDRNLYQKALDELEETSRQLEDEIKRLAPWGKRPTGKMAWPTAQRRITSPFGPRFHPILRTSRQHTGIDIGAPSGAKVTAAEWGIVRRAGTLGGYGKTVMIDHGGGVWTLYAHLSEIRVAVDQAVAKGELIGLVGSTGFSTGPHLHFEVRDGGTPVNPLGWLAK